MHGHGWVKSAGADRGTLAAIMAAMLTAATSATLHANDAMVDRANQAFGLAQSEVAALDVDRTPGVEQSVIVPFDGASVIVRISPQSVRADHYELRYQLANGSYLTADPGPETTVRGSVEGFWGSVVAGSVTEEGLTALIDFGDGRRAWLEPMMGRVAGATPADHVIYRDLDALPHGGSCATESKAILSGGGELPEDGAGCDTLPCVTELACDTDVEFVTRWGAGTEARIHLVINTVNVQYERDVGITHVITTIIVRPTEPDPYSSTDSNSLLSQFRSHWLSSQQGVVRDLAELFTGKEMNGDVIGQAFSIGVICTSSAYCIVQSDFSANFACCTDLSAHEMGHLWGGQHCNCPSHTMNPVLTCANIFHPTTSIPQIVGHRNSRTCLDNSAPPPAAAFPLFAAFTAVDDLVAPNWINSGAEINDAGAGEPSAPLSVDFNTTDVITTGTMNGSGPCEIAVSYWWQRTGMLGSPEPGEDLVMEFRSLSNTWIEMARHPGDGPDDAPFVHVSFVLPPIAHHANLQIRWRMTAGSSADHFFVDDIRVGCLNDSAPPVVVHNHGLVGQTRPFSGYVDPRRESANGVDVNQGVTQVDMLFSEPVARLGGGPLTPASFVVAQTGGVAPPTVAAVDASAMPLVHLTLSRPITPREWTTLRAIVQDQAETPNIIVNVGNLGPGVNESDRIDLGFLPGNIDQNNVVNPLDLLKFKQYANGVSTPADGTIEDLLDINRSGGVNPLDLLQFKQLINGISPPATQAWAGVAMNNPRP